MTKKKKQDLWHTNIAPVPENPEEATPIAPEPDDPPCVEQPNNPHHCPPPPSTDPDTPDTTR